VFIIKINEIQILWIVPPKSRLCH